MAKKKSAFEKMISASLKAQAKGKDPVKAVVNKLSGDAKRKGGFSKLVMMAAEAADKKKK